MRYQVCNQKWAFLAGLLATVAKFHVLPILPDVETLAAVYVSELRLPQASAYDALHIALASVHAIDYLVTWNCGHIANTRLRLRLADINRGMGMAIPVTYTPEELLDEDIIPHFVS